MAIASFKAASSLLRETCGNYFNQATEIVQAAKNSGRSSKLDMNSVMPLLYGDQTNAGFWELGRPFLQTSPNSTTGIPFLPGLACLQEERWWHYHPEVSMTLISLLGVWEPRAWPALPARWSFIKVMAEQCTLLRECSNHCPYYRNLSNPSDATNNSA